MKEAPFTNPGALETKTPASPAEKVQLKAFCHFESNAPAGRDGHLQNTAKTVCGGNSWSAHSVCLFVSGFQLTICHCVCGRLKSGKVSD